MLSRSIRELDPAFVASRSSPQAVSPVPASIGAMCVAWDLAAQALLHGDFPAFDQAMINFRKIHREAGGANNAPASNQ